MAPSARSPVVVSGFGACTCLGGARVGAAAARAGILRAAETAAFSYIDDSTNTEFPLIAHAINGVTDGFQGTGRLIRMGILGLEDLQSATACHPKSTALFLALPHPEFFVTADDAEDETQDEGTASTSNRSDLSAPQSAAGIADEVAAEIVAGGPLEGMPERPITFTDGRHGALRALQSAVMALREGRCESALVGACDSELDETRLARALAAGRLKTEVNPVGFMPGEASVFLLLEAQQVAASRGIAPVLVIDEPALGFEESSFTSERPARGQGLAEAAVAALGRLGNPGEHRGRVFIDLNGEAYRSADWGHASVRLRGLGLLADWPQQVLALSFGETGAASPLLALILAARSFARGYARGDTALVLTSDDGGNRGAATLTRT